MGIPAQIEAGTVARKENLYYDFSAKELFTLVCDLYDD